MTHAPALTAETRTKILEAAQEAANAANRDSNDAEIEALQDLADLALGALGLTMPDAQDCEDCGTDENIKLVRGKVLCPSCLYDAEASGWTGDENKED